MTEILTESFCERCGTRYTFESAAPRKSRLGRVRTVSKGVKNFVLSDESSFSEAMADARSDEERNATASQLDAFHRTFNFCLTCRQYTCGNCWNTAEGRCLTCMPLPGTQVADDLMPVPPIAFVEPTNGFHDHTHDEDLEAEPIGAEAWPEADLGVERLDRVMGAAMVADAVDLDELPPAEEAVAAEDADAHEEPAAIAESELAAPTPVAETEAPVELDEDAVVARIAGVAPGQSVEDALAAYEAQLAADEAEREHQTELAAITAAAMLVDDEPEPVAAVAEPVAIEAPADVAAEPGALVTEPEAAPLAAEPEPVVAEAEADHDALVAAAAIAAVTEPEVPEEPQAAADDDEHHRLAAAAAIAALAAPDFDVSVPQAEPPAPREDIVAQPTWPVAPAAVPPPPPPATAPVPVPTAQPEPAQMPAAAQPPEPAQPVANPWLTVAPDEGNQPEWPAAPIWGQQAAARREMPATLAGRALMPQDDAASMWAASAREVLNGTAQAPQQAAAANLAAQPCVSCGLSLSANARFCRRCGTRQG
jgi:ribosomal protein L40E